jgi:Kelch motif
MNRARFLFLSCTLAASCVGRSLGVDDPYVPHGRKDAGLDGATNRDGSNGADSGADGGKTMSPDGGGSTFLPPGVASCTRRTQPPARLPSAAYQIGATSGIDGLVYLTDMGGDGSSTAAYAYNVSSATFAQIASAPDTFVDGSSPVRIGAQIFAVSSVLYAYDTADGMWSKKSTLAPSRVGTTASVGLDGKIYDNGGVRPGFQSGSMSSFVYDPASDSWSTLPNRPQLDGFVGTATGPAGDIYVVGEHAVKLDVASQAWTSLPDPPTPRDDASLVSVGGKLYEIGGIQPGQQKPSDAVEGFDPVANTWATYAHLPTAVDWPSATLACDGQVYVFGGVNPNGAITSLVQVYDPIADAWQASP